MKTVQALTAFLLTAGLTQSCHAQYPVPYPVQGGPGVYPTQPGQFPYPGGNPAPGQFPSPQSPPPSQTQNAPVILPEGVSQLFALMGTNDLLAMATPEGYDRLRELVRNLDGDLDAIRTKVVSVDAQTSDLAALGVTVNAGKPSLTDADDAKLLSALAANNLRVTETLRITTRENTPVDTLLRNAGARSATGGTPFTIIPRESKDGLVTLEIHQPATVQVAVRSGQIAVVALPGVTTETVRLLFLTPTVLSSESRPMH